MAVWFDRATKAEAEHDALREQVKALTTALLDANDMCRSAYAVAERDGTETGWQAWRTSLKASLERQHIVLAPIRAARQPRAEGEK